MFLIVSAVYLSCTVGLWNETCNQIRTESKMYAKVPGTGSAYWFCDQTIQQDTVREQKICCGRPLYLGHQGDFKIKVPEVLGITPMGLWNKSPCADVSVTPKWISKQGVLERFFFPLNEHIELKSQHALSGVLNGQKLGFVA